ncbi:MAG: B-box zinc finger protein [Terracidiphilus sp.]
MDCVNHSGVNAAAYCQNCGKALCSTCVRNAQGGQILCEQCAMAWQNVQQPFVAPPMGGASPAAAAVLGLIPGVGAMYNGQFFKGLIHVVIFAVLVSISSHFPIFGIFIGAWVLYQSFEAYHTAIARRNGQPLPDPLGLNEVGNWLNLGQHAQYPGQYQGQPPAGPGVAGPWAAGQEAAPGGYQAPYTPGAGFTAPGFTASGFAAPGSTASGFTASGVPPVPPAPPVYWRRKEPLGALFLIGFGLLLLLNQLGWVTGQVLKFLWPLVFIGFGVWLIIRRVGDTKGGAQ